MRRGTVSDPYLVDRYSERKEAGLMSRLPSEA